MLFDGNRLPGAGINQAAPDAGVIPTSALQRVEILADGGSSVYGSDAVAGVINFIPRKDFNGAETTARVGFADGYNTYNFSQLFGRTWDSGSLLLDYEYSGNSHLSGNDRSYAVDDQVPFGGPDTRSNICSPANVTANGTTYALSATGSPVAGATNLCEANRAGDLYPSQYRNQVYGSLHQDVTDQVDLFGSVLFSDRQMSDRVAGTELTTGGLSVTVPSTSAYYIPLPGVPAGTPESVTYNPASDFGPYFTNAIHTETLSVILGTNFKLGNAWHGELILNDGIERDDVRELGINQTAATDAAAAGTFNPYGVGPANNTGVLQTIGNFETRYYVRQTIKDGQLKFDGPLFSIPGGPVKAAVGVDVRQEVFDGVTSSGPAGTSGQPITGVGSTPLVIANSSRNIDSGYAELHLPIVGESNRLPGIHSSGVSLAARYDHYGDFGSTTNPKVGFIWKVIDDLAIRGSAGSSFHAPSLADSPTAIDTRAIQFPCSPGYIGCAGAAPGAYGVVLAGGNKLKPETADTYNLGLDWMPKLLEGLALNLTYFRVDYKDVITFPTFAPVTNPLAAYDAYRTVRPAGISDAQWEAIIDPVLSAFRDQGLIFPTNPILPVAIYDLRRQNFANELINGIDYNLNYRFDNAAGKWAVGVAGTQFLTFYQQIPGVPQVVQLLDTDYAVRTKLRGTIGWNKSDYGANLFLNYVGHYTNENFTPYQSVSSFTTVDLHLTWTPPVSGILEHTQFTFDVTNLFDRDPPVYYTNNSNNGIPGFDPFVANAFGRILAVGFHKSW